MQQTEKVLNAFGKKVVQSARGILNATGKNASGDLGSSLGYVVHVYPSGAIEMDFVAMGYADIVDKGVRGSKSSAKAPKSPYRYTASSKIANIGKIDKWVVRKGLKSARDSKGRFIKRRSLVIAIATNIKLYGQKPSNFFSDAFNIAYRDLPTQFIKAYANDAQKFLKFVSKEIN